MAGEAIAPHGYAGAVARVLIVGCGCRGQALAKRLAEAGHAVRGTTRDPARADAIRTAGAEAYVGDPDRIATLMEALTGVTVLCWLLGTVPAPELHGTRLRMMLERLVDTPVRGVLYERPSALADGEAVARQAAEAWRIPLEVVPAEADDRAAWLERAEAAVDRLLGYNR
jgi:threonine dehydrogenase-like Zn-dependent dehydrogenase